MATVDRDRRKSSERKNAIARTGIAFGGGGGGMMESPTVAHIGACNIREECHYCMDASGSPESNASWMSIALWSWDALNMHATLFPVIQPPSHRLVRILVSFDAPDRRKRTQNADIDDPPVE